MFNSVAAVADSCRARSFVAVELFTVKWGGQVVEGVSFRGRREGLSSFFGIATYILSS